MDKPSNAWKNYVHDNKSSSGAAKASYELYLNKYAKDSTEFPRQEDFTDRLFISGKIYAFTYTTDDKPSKERPVISRRPVILSMGQILNAKDNSIYETGIDMMLVPPPVRVAILDNLYRIFKKIIEDNEKAIGDGRKGKSSMHLDYAKAKIAFSKLGWQQAYSAFNPGNILKPVVYDYDDWVTVLSLDTRGLQGRQMKEVFDRYIKKMTSALDVDPSSIAKK